jgi:hypothetical protein
MSRLLTRKNASNAISMSALALDISNTAHYETLRAISCAHKSAGTVGLVNSNGSTPVVLASATVTPLCSGAFVVYGTAFVVNLGGDTYPASLSIGHAGVVDYAGGTVAQIGDPDTSTNVVPMSIVADNHLTGQVFELGVPVTITLLLTSSVFAGSSLAVAPNGAQIFVQELTNV